MSARFGVKRIYYLYNTHNLYRFYFLYFRWLYLGATFTTDLRKALQKGKQQFYTKKL